MFDSLVRGAVYIIAAYTLHVSVVIFGALFWCAL